MFKKLFITFLVAIAMVLPQTSHADVISLGSKSIGYCFQLEGMEKYPDYTFLVHYQTVGGYHVMAQGECLSFYKLASPTIYAVLKTKFDEKALGTQGSDVERNYFQTNKNLIHSTFAIQPMSSTSENDPLASVADKLQVESLTDSALTIVPKSVKYTYTDGTSEEKSYSDAAARPLSKTISEVARPAPSRSALLPWWTTHFWYIIVPIIGVVGIIMLMVIKKRAKK